MELEKIRHAKKDNSWKEGDFADAEHVDELWHDNIEDSLPHDDYEHHFHKQRDPFMHDDSRFMQLTDY